MSLLLASGGDNIKLWDVSDDFSLVREYNPHASNIASLAWSHDNACLASASSIADKIAVTYSNANAASHSFEIGREEQRTCLAYNSMSRYIMGGGQDGLVHIWDLKTRKLKKTYKGHNSAVTSLQFNWNDTVIASGSEVGQIILFSVVTAIGFSPLVLPKEQAVRQLQYSHFKKSLLASASDDGGINLWDTSAKRLVHSYDRSHKAPAMGLAFSPLNEMLMMSVGLDKKIVCYDVVGKNAVKTMTAEGPLTSIDLMSDGATLAVGSTRGKIYIYDLRQGATPIKTISAHKSSVQSLKFHNSATQQKSDVGGKAKTTTTTTTLNQTPKPQSTYSSDVNKINNNFISQKLADVQKSTSKLTSTAKSPSNFGNLMEKDEIFSPLGENTNFVTSRRNQEVGGDTCSPPLPASTRPTTTTSAAEFTNDEQKLYGFEETNGASDSDEMNARLRSYQKSDALLNSSVSSQASSLDARMGTSDISIKDRSTSYQSLPRDQSSSAQLQSSSSKAKDPLPTSISRTLSEAVLDRIPDRIPSIRQPSPARQVKKRDSAASTPPDATPSQDDIAAASKNTTTLQPFHTQFIRNIVEESLDDFREQIRQDVLNLHMEMLKQFVTQQTEIERVIKEHSINEELLAEVVRLKEENRRLKKKF